jgi:hypothetical protein
MLATIALSIGVVVAGLGIGAFLSALQSKGGNGSARPTAVGSAPVVTPVPQPTRGPVVIATIVAHPTAAPTPVPTPRATPTSAPTPTVAPTVVATAVPSPSAAPVATSAPRPTATAVPATAAPLANATARAAQVAQATATPQPAATPRATVRPTPAPPPTLPAATPRAVSVQTPADAGPPAATSAAQNTVRRYLEALIAGNESAAYAALGRPTGDPSVQLSEEAFLDRASRITAIRTRSTDATGATIDVRIASSRGTYDATYHVTNGPGGPVIDQHDYIKV